MELKSIVQAVTTQFKDVEMVVLYGSYARGEQVEDKYTEKGTTYEYKSDFDLLVLLQSNNKANNSVYTSSIDKVIFGAGAETPVQPIYHGVDYVNRQLEDASYFFTEIVEQGIVLFSSNRYQLSVKRKLNREEVKAKAEKDFAKWIESAEMFFEDFESNFQKGTHNPKYYKKAAFELHQTTEQYYSAIQLVFTGYKPKTHDLEKIGAYVNNLDARFKKVFPRTSQTEEDCFILLKKAYVDARYDESFIINKEQLEYLNSRVLLLKELTEKICREKIESIL